MTILEALIQLRDDIKLWCINNFNHKLNKNLGTEENGKFLTVDSSGDIVTTSNYGVRSISTGSTNGTISVNTNGTSAEVAVKGLGSAAYTASTAYDAAGTAQTKADAALASAKAYTDSLIDGLTAEGDADAGVVQTALNAHIADTNNPHGVTCSQISAVPTSRTVNGKALSADISLTASDVGAAASSHTHDYAASSHNHAASNITSGTLSSDRLPTVPISKGGTGATDAATALANLGAMSATVLWENESYIEGSGTFAAQDLSINGIGDSDTYPYIIIVGSRSSLTMTNVVGTHGFLTYNEITVSDTGMSLGFLGRRVELVSGTLSVGDCNYGRIGYTTSSGETALFPSTANTNNIPRAVIGLKI